MAINSGQDPRKVFAATFLELGATNPDLVAVSCDSASGGGLGPFKTAYPARVVECGIGEQNATSVSAGLALAGYVPVLVAITPFITMRNYEQIRNDIGYANANVVIVASGGGLQYSTLGSSHETLEDVALMRTIPNMIVLTPGDGREVARALEIAVSHKGPAYLRMPRHALVDLPYAAEDDYAPGAMQVIREGDAAAVLAVGTMVERALGAAELLAADGVRVRVVNVNTVKPLGRDALLNSIGDCAMLFTVEEHCINGGLGTAVLEALATAPSRPPVHRIGMEESDFLVTGPYRDVLRHYGLTAETLRDRIAAELRAAVI